MPRLRTSDLSQGERDILNRCLAQGMRSSSAKFLARVYFPLRQAQKEAVSNNKVWKGVTQVQLAEWAGMSPAAAKKHLDYFLDIGIFERRGYRNFVLVSSWYELLMDWHRNQLRKGYMQALYT